MMELFTPAQMQQCDAIAIEDIGIPGAVLMERAASGAVDVLRDTFEDATSVGILCGGGNNGGDGFAMARLLSENGFAVQVVLLSSPDGIDGEAGANLDIISELRLPIEDVSDLDPDEIRETLDDKFVADDGSEQFDVWVDAMLGTGLDGDVRGRYRPAIEWLNRRLRVLAVDIPSGISGATGKEMGVAVDADATATFGGAKLGQALFPGRERCGRLHLIDIGIPHVAYERAPREAIWIDRNWARSLTRMLSSDAHKGDAGRLLVVAGSHEKTGAALLSARGALYGGAGLITVGTTEPVVSRIAPAINEVMAEELVGTTADPNHEEGLHTFLEGIDAVAIGPGLNTHDGAKQAVEVVLESDCDAAVLDADALNLLAHDVTGPDEAGPVSSRLFDLLREFTDDGAAILTPHPGEMARLRGVTIEEILDEPIHHARALASSTGATVVLKKADTLVAAPDGRLAVNSSGNPGMATGGTGDVLTGLIGAQVCDESFMQRTDENSPGAIDSFDAASLAVWVHGAAGDLAADETGQHGLSATKLAETVPAVWSNLEAPTRPGGE